MTVPEKELQIVREYLQENFGPVCGDFEIECTACFVWGAFEAVEEAVQDSKG